VLLIALAGAFVTSFPSVILVASLGEIADDLHTTESVVSWIVTAPLIAGSVLMPSLGKLGDLHGHRRVFLLGFVGSTVLGFVTAAAPGVGLVILARTFGQIAGAATQPTSLALIMAEYPPAFRSRAMGWWSFIAAASPAIGLVAGGPLVDAVGWRSVFVIQGALALVPMLLARFVLAETPKVPSVRFDVFGAATLAATSGGALFALNRGGEWGAGHPAVLAALTVAVAAGVAFVRSQRRRTDPLLPLDELTRRPFGAPVAADFFVQAATMGSFTLVPLLLREQLAYSVAGSVFVLLPLPIGMAAMAPLGGRLSTSIGERWTATLGGVSLVLGCALLAFGAHLESAAVIAGAFALVGAANGLGRPALVTSAANALRHSYMGVGVAITRMVSQLGAATGITTLVVVRGTNGFTTAFLVALPFAAMALLTASRVVSSAAEPLPVADPLG
jgi:MFS family permease